MDSSGVELLTFTLTRTHNGSHGWNIDADSLMVLMLTHN